MLLDWCSFVLFQWLFLSLYEYSLLLLLSTIWKTWSCFQMSKLVSLGSLNFDCTTNCVVITMQEMLIENRHRKVNIKVHWNWCSLPIIKSYFWYFITTTKTTEHVSRSAPELHIVNYLSNLWIINKETFKMFNYVTCKHRELQTG